MCDVEDSIPDDHVWIAAVSPLLEDAMGVVAELVFKGYRQREAIALYGQIEDALRDAKSLRTSL